MLPILLRTPAGERHSYPTREEFALAVLKGDVRDFWEVYHAAGDCWLPVTEHPVFRMPRPSGRKRVSDAERTQDLVLVHPDGSVTVEPWAPSEEPEPIPPAPAARRTSGPQRQPGARPSNPLLESAIRAVPTFSRAILGAAALVHQR